MKNNMLKSELRKWENNEKKRITQKPSPTESQPPDVLPVGAGTSNRANKGQPEKQAGVFISPGFQPNAEPVVGGMVLWKPIDRAAAMLLAKAPWWAHPPQVSQTTPQATQAKHNKAKTEKTMDIKTSGYAHPAKNPNETILVDKTREQMNNEIAERFIKQTDKTLDKTKELVDRAMDARAAMDAMCDTFKESWFEFQKTSDERLKELRMTRMATDSEIRQLLGSLREVRTFFLDADYAIEMARLKEFVETCERLQKLKDSGFLDTVADTMLRLADGHRDRD